jgi:TetR/AcrR family transcriptional regulator
LDDHVKHVGSSEREILVAAKELFAENTYDGVSMSEIAERAGVSKANLYHHYDSKEDLYFAVLRAACRQAEACLNEILAKDGPIDERLRTFAREHLAWLHADPQPTRLIMREVIEHSPRSGRKLAEEVFGSGFGNLVAVFQEGQERGELRDSLDPALAASLLLSACASFFQWRDVMPHMPEISYAGDPEGYADGVVDLLLHGIVGRRRAVAGDVE